MNMDALAERVERLRRILARYDELVLREATEYHQMLELGVVIRPCPGLMPAWTADEAESEINQHLDERSQVRRELACLLRTTRVLSSSGRPHAHAEPLGFPPTTGAAEVPRQSRYQVPAKH